MRNGAAEETPRTPEQFYVAHFDPTTTGVRKVLDAAMLSVLSAAAQIIDCHSECLQVHYRAFGLNILSDLGIPGALPGDTSHAPDIYIRHAPFQEAAGQRLPAWEKRLGPYCLTAEGLYFEQSSVAQYQCSADGTTLTVRPHPEATAAEMSAYLIATALPAMLWSRGERVLHAAAFVLPGEHRAIALMGASGIGKSTMLQTLVGEGCSVIAEDTLCLREKSGEEWVSGLPACLWLRHDHVMNPSQRCTYQLSEDQCMDQASLGAVLWLHAGETAGLKQRRLQTVNALDALLQNRHRPSVPSILGQHAALLPGWAALAQRTPVYHWSREQTTPALLRSSLQALLGESLGVQGG